MMKEEDIDKRIERVAESVGSKKAKMCQWEIEWESSQMRRAIASKRLRTYGISVAASIVVICAIGIGVYMNRSGDADYGITSSTPVYRGGSANLGDIKAMIDSAQYQMALLAIDKTMADTIIDPTLPEERQEYLRSVNHNQEYELIWLKIQALISLGKKQEATVLLENYVQNEGTHQTEAKSLLKKIQK